RHLENLAGQLAHVRLVLDEQDRLRAAHLAAALGRLLGTSVLRRARARQIEVERRALTLSAPDADVAAVLLHDAVDHREPETGAAALVLRREERLEDPRLDLGAHPEAVVDHRQTN